MATRRNEFKSDSPKRPPATSPIARENQLIGMSVDLAAKQIEEGTVSAQVLTHYLKLGSSREKLEQERLEKENELLEMKRDVLRSHKNIEQLYEKALAAMRDYQGQPPLEVEEENYDG